jgi:hypothetical protein
VKLQFSGHETFAFRHGWLKKVFAAIADNSAQLDKTVFKAEDAIAKFGVGRNMVNSMGHWAYACDVITQNKMETTEFGKLIFSPEEGYDPFLDDVGTLWLIHWNITSKERPSTTWHFAFHKFSGVAFDKQRLVMAIQDFLNEHDITNTAENTINRDVDCFTNTYAMKKNKSGQLGEDSLECPLVELSLITETENKGMYEFSVGPKDNLPPMIFLYALNRYFENFQEDTLSLENITYGPGSPGRAFKLDENSVAEYLIGITEISDGDFEWIDTAGLRQVQRKNPGDGARYLKVYYENLLASREAA